MTRAEREKLAELARAATPGPWEWGQCGHALYPPMKTRFHPVLDTGARQHAKPRDRAFIAAANPAVILELLSEREKLVAFVRSASDAKSGIYAEPARALLRDIGEEP